MNQILPITLLAPYSRIYFMVIGKYLECIHMVSCLYPSVYGYGNLFILHIYN